SLQSCDGIGDYRILANVEDGADETMAAALSADFAQIHIAIKPKAQNFSERAYTAIDRAFSKAEYVAYLDGDTVVVPDFLRYLEYGAATFRDDHDVFLVSCVSETFPNGTPAAEVSRRPLRFGCAAGIWRNRWEWSKRTTRAKAPVYLDALAKLAARHRLQEVYPAAAVSRRMQEPGEPFASPRDGPFREAIPPVTAVMITGLHRERYGMARVAIECFKAQTYPNKNLLIVNHGEQSLVSGDARIFELRLNKSRWQTVGDLRNLALEHATGDYVVNWDDDDWHHPRRIEVQMQARGEDTAVLLRTRIHHSLMNGCSRYAEYPRGAEASILHPRKVPYRYPGMLRGSDSVFAKRFAVRLPIDNDPAMHIRFFHGLNLWDEAHIMGPLANVEVPTQSDLSSEHRELLAQVLPLYGSRLPTQS
ncbi:MAG: glycosyltransferase family A protein, partial [Bryobacteraceae bacterium]